MTKEIEQRNLEKKLLCANEYLSRVWRTKGQLTTRDVFSVYSPEMMQQGVIFDITPARDMKFDDDFTVEFLKVDSRLKQAV